jgi:quinol monooxygenase YgiN
LWKGMKKRPTVVPFEMWEDMVAAELHRLKPVRQQYTESQI